MTTIYLIRHSLKEKNINIIESSNDLQVKNEKIILSIEGEEKALKLSKHKELQNIDELWSSNYVRAIATAKYLANNNNIPINISSMFDERHYGDLDSINNKDEFWINQFLNTNLKNNHGESLLDVQNRMNKKIQEIISKNEDKRIAIVCHNACILFYILKYCQLESAKPIKKLTITYKNKTLIKDNIMASPSIMKLEFKSNELINISYIEDI